MKSILILPLLICFASLHSVSASENPLTLAYHQNEKGEAISGSILALKTAVREGKRIRLYMKLKTVEHAMDSGFLSIFEEHVYAQINTIQGQRPNRNTKEIELRPYSKHVGLYSTRSPYEIKWYVY